MSDVHAQLLASAESHYAVYVSSGEGFDYYRGFIDACVQIGVDLGRIQAMETKVTAQLKGMAREITDGEVTDEEPMTAEDLRELEEIVGWVEGHDPFFQDEMSGQPTQ